MTTVTTVTNEPAARSAVTTMAGAIPLIISSGPGAESRLVIGTVIMAGVGAATVFTLFVLPVAYNLLGGFSRGPGFVSQKLDHELDKNPSH